MVRQPEVSVVIPTLNRPELVQRAVRSALAQTVPNIEVIVVIDGPDAATREALGTINDPRLRVIERESRAGAPAARNLGAREALAEWTALLDDDDEWLPEKLATQLAVAKEAPFDLPIVGSRLFVRTPRTEFVLPRLLPEAGQPTSEYLAIRRGLFHGDGFIQTSTILAPTRLFRQMPFADGLRRLQELDWTLRCLEQPGVGLVYASEPLVIWYADENRPRVSQDSPWQQSVEWLKETRSRVTPRAYAALAMSVVSSMAVASKSPRVCLQLLREAVVHGRPGLTDYVTFAQIWLIPSGIRRVVRDKFKGRRKN